MTEQSLISQWDVAAEQLEFDAMRLVRYGKCLRYLAGRLPAGARLLEVGCGEGTGLVVLQSSGAQVLVGVEVSIERLARAKRKVGQSTSLIAIGPDGRLPFQDDSFDAVVSAGVIEHTLDPSVFLFEIARVTRPGGEAIITSDCYSWRILQMLGAYRSVQPIDRAIFPTRFLRYFRESGLRLVHCEGFAGPGQGFRLFRILGKHLWVKARRLVRRVVSRVVPRRPVTIGGDMKTPLKAGVEPKIKSAESLRVMVEGTWRRRHWLLAIPRLIFSDENVFFLTKDAPEVK